MPRVNGVLLEGEDLLLVAKLARLGQRWVEEDPRGDRVPAPPSVRRLVAMLEQAAGDATGEDVDEDRSRPPAPIGAQALADLVGCDVRTITRHAEELGGWRVGRPWAFDRDEALVRLSAIGLASDTVATRAASSTA